jgi:recombination protein RecT
MSEEKGIQTTNRNPITAIVEPRTNELVQVFMGDAAKAERFKSQAATLAVAAPNLARCEPASLWLALKGVAELDLDLTPALGHAYILPYGSKATLIVGYKGLKEIAFRSGIVKRLEAVLVYKGDEFSYQRGTDPKIHHVPAEFGKRGEITGAYCTATLSNGEIVFEVMSRAEIDAIAGRSNSKAVWQAHYGEMARKTPLRRLAKYLPSTPLLSKALAADADAIDTEAPFVETKRPSLADNIAGRSAEPAPSNAKQLPPADARSPDVEDVPEDDLAASRLSEAARKPMDPSEITF